MNSGPSKEFAINWTGFHVKVESNGFNYIMKALKDLLLSLYRKDAPTTNNQNFKTKVNTDLHVL